MDIVIKGKRISYEVVGEGSPILLVHGWQGNRKSLENLAHELELNHKCFRIDLPGRGNSENPDPSWGVQEYGELVVEFIHKVIKEKPVYIGHSFGGALGVYIASTTDDLLKLVLSAPSFRREGEYMNKTTSKMNFVRSILKKIKPVRKLYYRLFYPHSELLSLEHLESNFIRVTNTDLTNRLGDIKVPTKIVWGADDIDTPLYQAYILNRGIKGSDISVYSGYGHELTAYYPKVISADIKLFIDSDV
ncbi:alpha/beta hydrolase [Candidatus Dojkabacteria bacterium]|nr:alpha/beta hydrolase [Candidatus Dojkabacteria bacterium]